MSLFNRRVCPVGVGFTITGDPQVIRCGRWSCPSCRKRLAYKWATTTQEHLDIAPPDGKTDWLFLTLTLGKDYRKAEHGYTAIPRLWDSTRKQYQRMFDSVSYIAFVEGQEARGGMPHFHIIINHTPPIVPNKRGRITQRMIHDWAYYLGWGFEVKLEKVDGTKASFYVAKYASKATPNCPPRFRRVRTSQDVKRLASDNEIPVLFPETHEDLSSYLLRVERVCDIPVDELYKHWTKAWERVYDYRNKSHSA